MPRCGIIMLSKKKASEAKKEAENEEVLMKDNASVALCFRENKTAESCSLCYRIAETQIARGT